MSEFVCFTQESWMDPVRGDDAPDPVAGTLNYIPRWKTSLSNPVKLQFFAVPDGYPTTNDFNQVVNTFISAADEWNKINFGVTISRTLDRRDANFLLTYQAKPSSSTKWPPLASAFIGPHKVSSVKIYGLALTLKAERDRLKTALLHEIGHVLGLRHELEFKPDAGKPPSGTTLQILAPNPNSVMNGEKRNGMQQSDTDAIKEFYKQADGWVLPGSDVKIKDFEPKLLPVKKP